MAKEAPKKKRTGNRVSVPAGEADIQLDNMQFWRDFAAALVPDLAGKENALELGEVAVALQEIGQQITTHWPKISRICDKNDDKCISVSFALGIDRRVTPAEVSVRSGYSEKYGETLKAKVPDPNQTELPGLSDGTKEPAAGEQQEELHTGN